MTDIYKHNYKEKYIAEFAAVLLSHGFSVWLNKNRTYGFYSDDAKQRVVYFQYDLGGVVLSGCYKANKEGGTGWRLDWDGKEDKETLSRLLHTPAPRWAMRHTQPEYMTVERYLAKSDYAGYHQINAMDLPRRHNIKVELNDGDTITTAINGSTQAIVEYYIGNKFNRSIATKIYFHDGDRYVQHKTTHEVA